MRVRYTHTMSDNFNYTKMKNKRYFSRTQSHTLSKNREIIEFAPRTHQTAETKKSIKCTDHIIELNDHHFI